MDINNGDKYKSAKWKYVNVGNIFSQEKKKKLKTQKNHLKNSNGEAEMWKNNQKVSLQPFSDFWVGEKF